MNDLDRSPSIVVAHDHDGVPIVSAPWTELLSANAGWIGAGTSFLVAGRAAGMTWLGPRVVPRQTPCLRCAQVMVELGTNPDLTRSLERLERCSAAQAREALRVFLQTRPRAALAGAAFRIADDGRPLAPIRLARLPWCDDCREAPPPAEIHYATQLFIGQEGRH